MVALSGAYPAELAVGFDAGGRESFRFGGAACAVGGDGGHLLWTLPEAQAGERIPQEVVWDLLEETLWAFRRKAGGFLPGSSSFGTAACPRTSSPWPWRPLPGKA